MNVSKESGIWLVQSQWGVVSFLGHSKEQVLEYLAAARRAHPEETFTLVKHRREEGK